MSQLPCEPCFCQGGEVAKAAGGGLVELCCALQRVFVNVTWMNCSTVWFAQTWLQCSWVGGIGGGFACMVHACVSSSGFGDQFDCNAVLCARYQSGSNCLALALLIGCNDPL